MMIRRALGLLLSLCVARCGASTRPITDASAESATDARAGACRWTAGAVIPVTPRGMPAFRLLDATAASNGAFVAYRESTRSAPRMWLSNVRDTTVTPEMVGTAQPGAEPTASVVFDAASDTRSALFSDVGTGQCLFVRRSADTMSSQQMFAVGALTSTFLLDGCTSLARTATGFSFLSEEVRALYGTQLLRVNESGAYQSYVRLPDAINIPLERPTRSALSDRSFVMFNVTGRGMPAQYTLTTQAMDENGTPRGEMTTIATTAQPPKGPLAIETSVGLLALWEQSVDSMPPVSALAARPLDRNAQPTGTASELTELGMLSGAVHATGRAGSVLVTGRFLDGSLRQRFAVLDARGAVVEPPLDISSFATGTGVATSRIVATATGALIVTEASLAATGAEIIAIPITCE